jgi:hypothetical protein
LRTTGARIAMPFSPLLTCLPTAFQVLYPPTLVASVACIWIKTVLYERNLAAAANQAAHAGPLVIARTWSGEVALQRGEL